MTQRPQACVSYQQSPSMETDDKTQGPIESYEEFATAIAQRDTDAVLALLHDDYGGSLREWKRYPVFSVLFDLWCKNYPRHLETIACYLDDETAILETQIESNGAISSAYVTLVYDDGLWRVRSERCVDGRTRTPNRHVQ